MNKDSFYMRIKFQAYTTFSLFRYRLTKNGYANIVNKKILQAFHTHIKYVMDIIVMADGRDRD